MPPYGKPFHSTWQMFEDGAHIDLAALSITACHQSSDHYVNLLPEDSKNRSQECLQWTYGELRHAALVIAKAMSDAGVKRGSTIMAPLPNGVETHLARIVSFILQLTLVTLDADLVEPGRSDELAYFIQATSPQVFLVPDGRGASSVYEAAKQIGHAFDFQFLTQGSEAPGCISWAKIDSSRYDNDSLEDLAAQQQPDLDKDGHRVALILFTSGTSTGRPKGAPQTVENIVSAGLNQMWVEDLGRVYGLHSPHSRAIYNCWGFAAMAWGHHVVQTHSAFDPEKTYHAISRHGIEMFLFVPAQIKILASHKHLDFTKLKSVRRILIGGDIVTTDLLQKAERLFPHARSTTLWGMSEGTGPIGMKGLDITPPVRTYRSIATLGKVGRWSGVRISDPNGKVLPRGEEGELVINGPGMVTHYINNVQPESFYTDDRGSWIRTGDKAVMDEDDHIFIIGRIKDIIKQSGINISPGVLEATLNKHDGINAAIVGFPDPIRGEVPVAVNSGVMKQSIKARVKKIVVDSLGNDFALKEVYGLAELGMKDFPFNGQGKLLKFKLKNAIVNLERKKLMGEMFWPWFI